MRNHLFLWAVLLIPASSVLAAQNSGTPPTAEEIVTRMAAHDVERQASIEGYAGMRRYVLENQHFHKRAEILDARDRVVPLVRAERCARWGSIRRWGSPRLPTFRLARRGGLQFALHPLGVG